MTPRYNESKMTLWPISRCAATSVRMHSVLPQPAGPATTTYNQETKASQVRRKLVEIDSKRNSVFGSHRNDVWRRWTSKGNDRLHGRLLQMEIFANIFAAFTVWVRLQQRKKFCGNPIMAAKWKGDLWVLRPACRNTTESFMQKYGSIWYLIQIEKEWRNWSTIRKTMSVKNLHWPCMNVSG